MKKFLSIFSILLLSIIIVESFYILKFRLPGATNLQQTILQPKPLLTYSFENLKKAEFPANPITLGSVLNQNTDSTSQIFYYSVSKTPNSKDMKKVSGVMNFPNKPGNYPVIIMFRGFVSEDTYQPGIGTEPVAKVLAKEGFITLAPDFLGYGESDLPSKDAFESRFQTYTTALTLLSSIETINNSLKADYQATISADLKKIGIWGHSNGGNIAISALEASGVTYPTVLWAPVSTSFPYSILYYTNESDDQGKQLRSLIADFEKIYDANKFSPSNFYDWIKAPIEIEQGQNDHEVPIWWSDDLVNTLKKDAIDVSYNTYPDADHNLLPNGWSQAVINTVAFYHARLH